MKRHHCISTLFFCLIVTSLMLAGCGHRTQDDFRDISIPLVNQNGETVTFPDDLMGKPVLLGFIYTNCPDICSFITANLYKTWVEMDQPEDVHFVLVTFDPERDTPQVLKQYASAFNMDRPPFQFLTGEKEEVERMMERVGIRTQVSYTKELEDGELLYFLNHTDRILLLDQQARLFMEYGGSMTPTRIFTEDLNQLL